MPDIATIIISLIATGISLMPIVLFPASGEIVNELGGVFNLGLEGIMLLGGITAYLVILVTMNILMGVLAGILVGALVAAIAGYFLVRVGINQVVFGLGIFLLGSAVSSVLFLSLERGTVPVILALRPLTIPFLSSIPYLGPIFSQNILVYVSLAIALAIWYVLERTWLGLRIRAIGQDAAVADSLGLNVSTYRFAGLLVSGILASLGGIYIIVCILGLWVDNVTAGAGFIAIGLLRVGSWKIWKTLLACLAYSTVNALQYTIQIIAPSISPQIFQAIPYVVVILLLATTRSKEREPRSLGIPYKRE